MLNKWRPENTLNEAIAQRHTHQRQLFRRWWANPNMNEIHARVLGQLAAFAPEYAFAALVGYFKWRLLQREQPWEAIAALSRCFAELFHAWPQVPKPLPHIALDWFPFLPWWPIFTQHFTQQRDLLINGSHEIMQPHSPLLAGIGYALDHTDHGPKWREVLEVIDEMSQSSAVSP